MDDNWRISIGYICVALVGISFIIGAAWMMSPSEFTIRFEMDDNAKEAIESIEYPIVDINTDNNSLDIKPSNSVTKAKIQKPTPDNGTKLGSANSSNNTNIGVNK